MMQFIFHVFADTLVLVYHSSIEEILSRGYKLLLMELMSFIRLLNFHPSVLITFLILFHEI